MLGKKYQDAPLPYVKSRPTTNPILPVDDMAAAISFYESLGFEVRPWDENYAWVKHCGWEWFHLSLVDSVQNNHTAAYLHVDDAAAWRRAMIEASGGSVDMAECVVEPWGKLEYSLRDPAGNLVRIGSPS